MPIKSRIRTIPNYPQDGIMFRDITTLLQDPFGFPRWSTSWSKIGRAHV